MKNFKNICFLIMILLFSRNSYSFNTKDNKDFSEVISGVISGNFIKTAECKKTKIYVFSKNYCRYCKMLKNVLLQNNIEYEEVDITDKPWMHEMLKKATGSKTVPYVFLDKNFIGGYTDFVKICQFASN